jgi:molybdopterin-guanine dinucleotide biosynthesis protein A
MTLTTMLMAGGQSRRMGFDKATLTINGEPLWQRQLRILSGLKPVNVCVSARNSQAWCPPNLTVILDDPPSRGPLSGLVAGFARLQTSHLLALAIDLPNISTDHLRKLCGLARPGWGVIPKNAQHFEPLCAIYAVEAAPMAREALACGDVALQHLAETLIRHDRMEVYTIPDEERMLYHNLNRPCDLRQFPRADSGQMPPASN